MTIDPSVVVAAIGALAAAIGRILWVIYTDLRKDRDFWRDAALSAMQHTDKATDVAAVAVKKANGA